MDEVRESLVEAINSGKTTIAELVREGDVSRATADRYAKGEGNPRKTTIRLVSEFLEKKELLKQPDPHDGIPAVDEAGGKETESPEQKYQVLEEVLRQQPEAPISKAMRIAKTIPGVLPADQLKKAVASMLDEKREKIEKKKRERGNGEQ